MWSFTQQLRHNRFEPKIILVNFEIAAHVRTEIMFPDCALKCCGFNLSQSWYRKIDNLGLQQKDYINDIELGKSLKYFFGLPHLSADTISDAFAKLFSITSNEVISFTDYFVDNYIQSNSRCPSSLWAHSTSTMDPTTSNAAKAFHRHFKQHYTSPHPNIHHLSLCKQLYPVGSKKKGSEEN